MPDLNIQSPVDVLAAEQSSRKASSSFDKAFEILNECEYETFSSEEGEEYVRFRTNGHFETWAVGSRKFSQILSREFYRRTKRALGKTALEGIRNHLAAEAQSADTKHQVNLRVAEANGNIYIDMCDKHWRAIRISTSGVRVVKNPPVRFVRTPGMKPLPKPELEGSIDELRCLLNIKNDRDWHLLVGFLISSLNPHGPYFILMLLGPHGTAKSEVTKQVRHILDPSGAPLRGIPRKLDDLWASAKNERILTLDNATRIGGGLSDELCRISTGGGTSARQHYEHGEQVLFQAERPIILNGISPSGIGEDMLDRSIAIKLPRLTKKTRLPRRELEKRFDAALPRVLGGLCKALSATLRNQASTSVHADVRMLDGAIFVTAAEEALGWKKGTFVRAYQRNQKAIVKRAIEEDPVASAVVELIEEMGKWKGTATDLHTDLDKFHTSRFLQDWPRSAASLSRRLEEVAPFLRIFGIEIERDRDTGKDRTRLIFISRKRPRPKLKKRKLRIGKKLLKRRAKKGTPG